MENSSPALSPSPSAGKARGRPAAGPRGGRATRMGAPREPAPRRGDRVDPAFGVRRRPEGRPVVEEGPPVPVAVPAVPLQGPPERLHVGPPALRPPPIAALLRDRDEGGHHGVEETAAPGA